MFQYKQSSFWWLRNTQTFIYFLRECTGGIIAACILTYIGAWLSDSSMQFESALWWQIVNWVGFGAAVIHTLTWFWVTTQLSPVRLSLPAKLIICIGMISGVIVFSSFALRYLYA